MTLEKKREAPTTSEQLDESVVVQATPKEIIKVLNVKTEPRMTAEIPNCDTSKMEKSEMYKESCSGQKSTCKSSKSDRIGLFDFQALKWDKPLTFPIIFKVTKTQTKLCSANYAQERKVNHDRPNEEKDKANTATAAVARPMSIRVVHHDGTLSDPVLLHAQNGKKTGDEAHNAITDQPLCEVTVPSIQKNGNSSLEDYGNMKKAKAQERLSRNKRTFSNSLVIPDNYKSDPKRFSDVEVKLRRLDVHTGNTSDASRRNSLAATSYNGLEISMAKPNTVSAFNQLKGVEITSGLESIEGIDQEPVDIIDVLTEPMETENFTADHTAISKQSEKRGRTRKGRGTKRKLNETETEVLNEIIEIIAESAAEKGFAGESSDVMKSNQHQEKYCIETPTDSTIVIPDMVEHAGGEGRGQYLPKLGQSIPSPPPLVRYGYASSSAIASTSGQPEKVSFAGIGTNYGFLRLFPEMKLAEKSEDAGILIIPADENFITSRQSSDVFKALVGRKRLIVSNQWVTDSLMMGSLQDKTKFLVKGTEKYGEWSPTENYHDFEYQIGDRIFNDITTDDIRHLLNAIGGKEQLVRTLDTIHICADGETVTLDHSVPKDWIFKCITSGTILSTYQTHDWDTTPEVDPVSESDGESSVVSSNTNQEMPEMKKQSKRMKLERKPLKRLCCVYCEALRTKLARHLEDIHSSEPEVAKALSFPKKSRERAKIWALLAAKGSFIHNSKVKMKGSGDLIVKRQLKNPNPDIKYLPCEFCNAEFSSISLWRHHKTCPARPAHVKSSGAMKNARKLLPGECQCSNELKKKALKKMRENITENSENNQPGAAVDRRENIIENSEMNQPGAAISMDSRETVAENNGHAMSVDGRESVAENNEINENNQSSGAVSMAKSVVENNENNEKNHSGRAISADGRESVVENNEDNQSCAAISVDGKENVVENNENNQSDAYLSRDGRESVVENNQSDAVVMDKSSTTVTELPASTIPDTSTADDNRMPKKKGSGRPYKPLIKTPWSNEEKEVVERDLKRCFQLKILPKKFECLELIEEYPILSRRSWRMIKDHVRTRLLSMERARQKEL